MIPEDWGGDTIMVPVSAHQKTGITDLLEMILLVAEMQELKANPNLPAHGTIIEAQLDKGRGPVATVLVQRGTLHIGDTIIAGTSFGKVRAMVNDRGEKVKKALPSTPVEVLGLNDVPQAGDILDSTDEKIYKKMTGSDNIKRVFDGIEEAQNVGLSPVRINAVLIKGINDLSARNLIELARGNEIDVRFIELMPFSDIGENKRLIVTGRPYVL